MYVAYCNVKVMSHWDLRKLRTEKLYVLFIGPCIIVIVEE